MYGQCVAAANSPAALVEHGLRQWLELGVPRSKLVLGLPWYAYDYPCQPAGGSYRSGGGALMGPGDEVCHLEAVPFQGAPCSDAAGRQREYQDVMQGEGVGGRELLFAFIWMVHRTYMLPSSRSVTQRPPLAVLRSGRNTTNVRWDPAFQSPYFNYRADDGGMHQVCAAFS